MDDPNKIASLPGMNAFYFSTNVGAQSSCQDIPPSGMLIQSPTGHKINFQLNGVKVTMGSSLLFVSQPDGSVAVLVVEGQGTLQIGDKTLVLNPSQAAIVNAATNKLQRGDHRITSTLWHARTNAGSIVIPNPGPLGTLTTPFTTFSDEVSLLTGTSVSPLNSW